MEGGSATMNGKSSKIVCVLGLATAALYVLAKISGHQQPLAYTHDWIANLSNTEWEVERESIRQKWCSSKYSDVEKLEFRRILDIFDQVKREMSKNDGPISGPAYHREHGFNLYKP